MGTNYYLLRRVKEYESLHVGKRSAAGHYCWDCRITLCKGGNKDIHEGDKEWHETCPVCGKAPNESGWDNAAGLELGLAKSSYPIEAKHGVSSCSSFTWDISPERFAALKESRQLIDEYDRKTTVGEFRSMLKNQCPIEYIKLVGNGYFS